MSDKAWLKRLSASCDPKVMAIASRICWLLTTASSWSFAQAFPFLRNQVPGFRGFLEKGLILDTIEVACTWDRVAALYERATASLRQVPGLLVASAHSSHSYRSGTNLYITFVARPEPGEDSPDSPAP